MKINRSDCAGIQVECINQLKDKKVDMLWDSIFENCLAIYSDSRSKQFDNEHADLVLEIASRLLSARIILDEIKV